MQPSTTHYKKPILACCIGNFIEVYDYSHFMYFAPIIASAFFPANDSTIALVLTFCIYTIERFIRPIAGIYLGRYIDAHGRSKTLFYSVIGMVFTSLLMCILPTYNSIGIIAPILLLVIRTIQGISMSSEFTTSIAYIYEHAPVSNKGILGSISFLSGILGSILSSILSFGIIYYFSKDFVLHWGWRLPYLIGIVILLAGYKLRKDLEETPEYISHRNLSEKISLKVAPNNNLKNILLCFSLTALSATTFSIFLVYMPSHLSEFKQLKMHSAISLTTINLMFYACLLPAMGYISDKIGRDKLIIISTITIFMFSYPAYFLLNSTRELLRIETILLIYMIFIAGLNAPIPAFISELFPVSSRVTSLAISYGTSLSLFGGIAPILCVFLPKIAGDINATGIYIMICALACIYFLTFSLKPQIIKLEYSKEAQ